MMQGGGSWNMPKIVNQDWPGAKNVNYTPFSSKRVSIAVKKTTRISLTFQLSFVQLSPELSLSKHRQDFDVRTQRWLRSEPEHENFFVFPKMSILATQGLFTFESHQLSFPSSDAMPQTGPWINNFIIKLSLNSFQFLHLVHLVLTVWWPLETVNIFPLLKCWGPDRHSLCLWPLEIFSGDSLEAFWTALATSLWDTAKGEKSRSSSEFTPWGSRRFVGVASS